MTAEESIEKALEGSAKPLIEMALIAKKSELKKHCANMVIRASDFAEFILAAEMGLLPWRHRIHHREIRPAHLEPTEEERNALGMTKPGKTAPVLAQKFMSKVSAIFSERRLLVGHMFWTMDHKDWHFFYFDQRDTSETANHWSGGAHIHYLSHLWPQRTAQDVWNEFLRTESPKMRNALHIRFKDIPEDRRTYRP